MEHDHQEAPTGEVANEVASNTAEHLAEAEGATGALGTIGGDLLNGAAVIDGLGHVFGRDETIEERVKGGATATGGFLGLAGSDMGPVVGGSVAAYELTKTGSERLQQTGVFGRNDDGTNRDSSDWAAHAGRVVCDGLGGGIVGNTAGLITTLGGSFVSGSMALGAGVEGVVEDAMSPIEFDEIHKRELQLEAAEAAKRKHLYQDVPKMPDEERHKAIAQAFGFWAE